MDRPALIPLLPAAGAACAGILTLTLEQPWWGGVAAIGVGLGLAWATVFPRRNANQLHHAVRAGSERLQALNTFQQAILHATDLAILATGPDGRIRSSNPAAEALFGYATEELQTRTPAQLIDPAELPDHHAFATLTAAAVARGHDECEWTCRNKDGAPRPLRLAITALRDDDTGILRGFLIVCTDLRERRRLEDQLERFFTLSLELLCLADKDGRFVRVNPAWTIYLGWSQEELRRKPFLEFVHPQDRASTQAELASLQTGGFRLGFEHRFAHKDGTWRHLRWSAAADPTNGMVIGAAHDVSAELETEHALRSAKEQAELLARTKSDFLATMSHEIRTPLNGIVGMTSLLLDSELASRQRDYVETVRSCSDSLLALINDILDFSKIEAGYLELEDVDHDLRQTIEEAVHLFAERAQAKGLELTCSIAGDVPLALHGDPGRLRQIVVNLAGNAVKFTERGEIAVAVVSDEIANREHPQPGIHHVVISVRDSGIGIDAKTLPHLFQPFSQADASTTRRFGGTGLGLAISRRLAGLMGGTIEVDSLPGTGSTFRCRLPLRTRIPSSSGLHAAPELLDARVLVVDPHPTARAGLVDLLTSWGLAVQAADSGPEALLVLRAAAAAHSHFHLVLIDWNLPDGDGLTMAQTIANDAELSRTAAVAMTPIASPVHEDRLSARGLAGCLTKPIRQVPLYENLVQHILGRERPSSGQRHRVTGRNLSGRVLIAEDNAVNQRVALALCTRLGLRADAVGDGLEAVQALARAPYDVVLMDCQMPEMDGFTATREIRRRERHLQQRTPIIALTANAMNGDRERCLEAGMDDYLSKPIRLEGLHDMLSRWLPADSEALSSSASPALEAVPVPDPDFDPSVLQRLGEELGSDAAAVLRDIIEQFLLDAPDGLHAVQQAMQGQDATALTAAAHRLKGQALTLGCTRVATCCAGTEHAARDGQLPAARATAGELPVLLDTACTRLRIFRESLATP